MLKRYGNYYYSAFFIWCLCFDVFQKINNYICMIITTP